MSTQAQREHAQKSRARAVYTAVAAGVLWLAALLPVIIPSLNAFLNPHWQQELARVAGLVTALAAFFAKDSGASQIPNPKGDD